MEVCGGSRQRRVDLESAMSLLASIRRVSGSKSSMDYGGPRQVVFSGDGDAKSPCNEIETERCMVTGGEGAE